MSGLAEVSERLRVYQAVQRAGVPVPTIWIREVSGVASNRLARALQRLENNATIECVGVMRAPDSRFGARTGRKDHRLYVATTAALRGPDEVLQRAPALWISLISSAAEEALQCQLDPEHNLVLAILKNAAIDSLRTGSMIYFGTWYFQAYCELLGVMPAWAKLKWERMMAQGETNEY